MSNGSRLATTTIWRLGVAESSWSPSRLGCRPAAGRSVRRGRPLVGVAQSWRCSRGVRGCLAADSADGVRAGDSVTFAGQHQLTPVGRQCARSGDRRVAMPGRIRRRLSGRTGPGSRPGSQVSPGTPQPLALTILRAGRWRSCRSAGPGTGSRPGGRSRAAGSGRRSRCPPPRSGSPAESTPVTFAQSRPAGREVLAGHRQATLRVVVRIRHVRRDRRRLDRRVDHVAAAPDAVSSGQS